MILSMGDVCAFLYKKASSYKKTNWLMPLCAATYVAALFALMNNERIFILNKLNCIAIKIAIQENRLNTKTNK